MKRLIQSIVTTLIAISGFGLNAQSISDAQKYLRNEQYEDAERTLKEIITNKPKDHQAYYLLGLTYSTREEFAAAMTAYTDGLTAAHKCKINQAGVGTIKLFNGDAAAAKSEFDAALAQSKKKFKAEINREIGRAYIMKGNMDEANALFWGKTALVYLGAARTLKPNDYETEILLGDAYMLTSKSDASKPVEQYQIAGLIKPGDSTSLIKQADIYRRAGNPQVAKKYAEDAISKDPDYAPSYRVMGSILSDLKENAKALEYFQEYLKRNNNLSARRAYVSSLYLNGKFNEAIKEGKDLLSKKEFGDVNGVIALSYIAKENPSMAESEEGLKYLNLWEQKEFAAKGKVFGSFENFQKATLLERTGNFAGAEGLYLQSIKDTANVKASLIETVASKMYEMKNYSKFVELINLKIAKNGVSELKDKISLGSGYSQMGEYAKAMTQYKNILKQDSTATGAYALIGRTSLQTDTNDISGAAAMNYGKWINSLTAKEKVDKKDDIKNTYLILAGAALRRKDWPTMLANYKNIKTFDPLEMRFDEVIKNLEKFLAKK